MKGKSHDLRHLVAEQNIEELFLTHINYKDNTIYKDKSRAQKVISRL